MPQLGDATDVLAGIQDTCGTALANVLTGVLLGVSCFDSSAGGLGGCPFAPGATGNLATEDLIYLLDGLGVETGVDLGKVVIASRVIASAIGRVPAGARGHAGNH